MKILFLTASILLSNCILSPQHDGEVIKVDCNKPARHKYYTDSTGAFHQTIDCATDTTKGDSAIFPETKPNSIEVAK